MKLLSYGWDFPTVAEMFAVVGATYPRIMNCYYSDLQKALPWPKKRRLSHRALQSDAWFRLWTCGRKIGLYIYLRSRP